MTRTPYVPALAGLALVSILLAGCTTDFLVSGGGSATAAPTPTGDAGTSAPDEPAAPERESGCDALLLDRPGNYVIGDCGIVTIEGSGIDLVAGDLGTLLVRGDRADVVGGAFGRIEVQGQANDIAATDVGDVRINGEDNTIVADGRIGSVVVDGNGNVVSAGSGVGSTIDNGLLNEIG